MSVLRYAMLCIILCSVVGFASTAHAAEAGSKRQLIDKFILVTDMQARYNQMAELMLNQGRLGIEAVLQRKMQQMKDATPAQKKRFGQVMDDSLGRLTARLMAAFKEKMPFPELVDRVYYPLYDKHFSISEMEAIVTFYESPAGSKFVSAAPVIMQESVSLVNELYVPTLRKAALALAEEELERIKPELEKIGKEE